MCCKLEVYLLGHPERTLDGIQMCFCCFDLNFYETQHSNTLNKVLEIIEKVLRNHQKVLCWLLVFMKDLSVLQQTVVQSIPLFALTPNICFCFVNQDLCFHSISFLLIINYLFITRLRWLSKDFGKRDKFFAYLRLNSDLVKKLITPPQVIILALRPTDPILSERIIMRLSSLCHLLRGKQHRDTWEVRTCQTSYVKANYDDIKLFLKNLDLDLSGVVLKVHHF